MLQSRKYSTNIFFLGKLYGNKSYVEERHRHRYEVYLYFKSVHCYFFRIGLGVGLWGFHSTFNSISVVVVSSIVCKHVVMVNLAEILIDVENNKERKPTK